MGMSALDDITISLTEHRLNKFYYERWQRDNKVEAPKVIAYLDGGSRPSDAEVETHYGKGLLFAEDARRKLSPPVGSKLRDKPPGYPDYPGYARVAADGRGYYEWADTQDVLFDLGNFSYAEGIALVGGRNVVIIGGHITSTGSNRAVGVGLAVWPRVSSSRYYLEGLRIKPSAAGGVWQRQQNDGIALRGPSGRLTIQNCLIGPVAIKQGYTSADAHADVLQIQAEAPGVDIRVDYLTGYTEYTGIMESAFKLKSQNWAHVNLVATGYAADDLDPLTLGSGYRGHTAFGMYDAGIAHNMPNLTMTEFYWAKDPLQSFQGYSPPELVSQKGAKYGKPPEGDFVTEEAVELPYVSPGYQ